MSTSSTATATTEATTAIGTAAGAVDTGARTDEAAELITGARERIDDLDRRIVALVRERVAVSEGIQRARLGSGGRRVNLAREMEIIGTYSDQLGKPGTALAMTLLELCRGRV
ncbi:chorismate mutase [Streptomyces sp. ICBB 8177]|uniref:chorismate mutase n=1 Tax=Streptomyces sp. ICBB 8177 TaxID=563922 RepID=UPI000D67E64B|nr:chorismate mutase [Streptomyces sp. ICBB 8177]PWI43742.1 chorismate mutase [Streptomyces sp. ICBB 8177]